MMSAQVFSSFVASAAPPMVKEGMQAYEKVMPLLERAAKTGVDPQRIAGIMRRARGVGEMLGRKSGEGSMRTVVKPQTKLQRILKREPEVVQRWEHAYPHGSKERQALIRASAQHGALSGGIRARGLVGTAKKSREKIAPVIPIETAARAVQRAA